MADAVVDGRDPGLDGPGSLRDGVPRRRSETVFCDSVLKQCEANRSSPRRSRWNPGDSADWRPMARNPLQRVNP
jgi:hypothetical protein